MNKLNFKVNRDKWGTYKLRNHATDKYCILGFFLKSQGVSDWSLEFDIDKVYNIVEFTLDQRITQTQLENKEFDWDTGKPLFEWENASYVIFGSKEYSGKAMADRALRINDSQRSQGMKEAMLTRLFKEVDIDVEFYS